MLIVDAHVHFYPCFRRDRFLDAAWRNLMRHSASEEGRSIPYVLLAETPEADFFRTWRDESTKLTETRWRIDTTDEGASLLAFRQDGAELVIVAGRQVPTVERLEVLALGVVAEVPRGLTLHGALSWATGCAPIVCIPWGLGKWWFGRERIVREVLRDAKPGRLFLGDGAGRPRSTRTPPLFRAAAERGIGILPGSDPFPFPRHEERVGTLCGSVDAVADRRRPLEGLATALHGTVGLASRGVRLSQLASLRDQLELRLRAPGNPGRTA